MWVTPKTDWQARYDSRGYYIGDYVNVEDYNRIKNNLLELREMAAALWNKIPRVIVGEDKEVVDDYYADEWNLIEDGLDDFYTIEVVDEIDSTNNYCKLNAAKLHDGYVLVADTQSGGRGRNGRSFYSPKQTGIYFTIFLRPKVAIDLALKLTAAAGTAVAEAIEKNYPLKAEIKWVNDVLVNQKKVTGILCEAGFEMNTANLDYMIVGIGINVHPRTFPDDIENIAGSIEDFTNLKVSRNVLLKDVLNIFLDFYRNIDANSFLESYRSHSCLIGKEVTVIEASKTYRAKVIDIDQNANLVVEKDGIRSVLSSGEIHIRDYY